MSWRVRPDEVLLEVGRLFGSKTGLQKLNVEHFGISSGRASITSCASLPPTKVFTTIGIYKGERVAIKKISKKKVMNIGIKNFNYYFDDYIFSKYLKHRWTLHRYCYGRSNRLEM